MKFKKMIIISSFIFLLFLILGTAYSTDDFNNSEDETILESSEDTVLESEQDSILEADNDDFECEIDDAYIDRSYSFILMGFGDGYNQTGNITVVIDDEIYYNAPLEDNIDYSEYVDRVPPKFKYCLNLGLGDLNKPLEFGTHRILVKNVFDDGEKILANTAFNATYYFVADDTMIEYGTTQTLRICLPKDATGILTATYNGKTKKVPYSNGIGKLVISSSELNIADNIIQFKLTGDEKYPDLSSSAKFTLIPQINPDVSFFMVNVGENAYITMKVPKKVSGTFKIYNTLKKKEYDYYWQVYDYVFYKGDKVLASAKFVDGVARISTSKFATGNHHLFLVFKSGDFEYGIYFNLAVVKNNPKVTVSFSTRSFYEGGKTVATIKSPAKKGMYMYYLIDGKINTRDIDLSKGKAYKGFYKLKAGTHKIRMCIYDKDHKIYYSKVFKITVKPKVVISAKNIAFKKSHSKFTVKTILKIKGKLAKYKKISIKINGKTYKAKTNYKGIAKKTFRKSVLKDIKVGQKVKFQVSYGTKTINRYIAIK